ncbi:hypothetical protein AB0D65_29650 [Streptomyces griseoloalbus]|uniref:Uncharacterized protein n=1 Tax=Streptomyces griseoloalbus TaxID=67303 RepID=A0ABV3ED31_9ACTN
MTGQIFLATRATADNWRHLAAVARAYHRNPYLEAERFASTVHRIAHGGDATLGGTGVEVALFGATQITDLIEQDGHHWDELLQHFPDLDTLDPDVQRALGALQEGRTDVFEYLAKSFDRMNTGKLAKLLGVLGGVVSMVDPDGTRKTLVLDGTEAALWSANPRKVPEWRSQLVARLQADETAENTVRELPAEDLQAMFPGVEPLEAARLLCGQEADRLSHAKLFHADADTSAVATRKAAQPRKTPLSELRVPSPYGLIVFETPIDWSPGFAPLVAASWGREEQDGRVHWWMTHYVHTAGAPPFTAQGFALVAEDDVFADNEMYSTDKGAALAVRAVVACWDVITQDRVGKPVTDITEERRQPKRLRNDRRRGVADDGTVRLVTIRGRRPSTPAPRRPDDSGPSRRYDRGRWWVTEHTRSQCMNPALHQDEACTHEDITILEHPKGPADKPFLDTVHLVRDAD